jgi:hypothetical protein
LANAKRTSPTLSVDRWYAREQSRVAATTVEGLYGLLALHIQDEEARERFIASGSGHFAQNGNLGPAAGNL